MAVSSEKCKKNIKNVKKSKKIGKNLRLGVFADGI